MLIKVEHLRKAYSPDVVPIRDLNCEIREGDVISIIGPSGTGKSTFLNLLNRLEEPTDGKIWFEGEDTTAPGYDLTALRRKIGMVFQSFHLFSHLTLAENVMLGPVQLLKKSRQEAYDEAVSFLTQVGLGDKVLSFPSELSGGQQQRAAIARAMAMKPKVLLFDEPTSALDPTMIGEVLAVIRILAKSGVTMLIVTHEMSFAREVSSRVFYLDEGGVYEEGTPSQIFGNPQRDKTRIFVRHVKAFEWSSETSGQDTIRLMGELELFAYRQMLGPSLTRRILMMTEEILAQIHRESPEKQPELRLRVEYAEREQRATMDTEWTGPSFNPLEQGDEYSRILIRYTSTGAVWERKEDRNCIHGIFEPSDTQKGKEKAVLHEEV